MQDKLQEFRENKNKKDAISSATRRKQSRLIARMAVDRLDSKDIRNYEQVLSPRLTGVDENAAYEWCRYLAMRAEWLKINNEKLTEFLIKHQNDLKLEMDAISDWIEYKQALPTTGNEYVLKRFPTKNSVPAIAEVSTEDTRDLTISDTENYFIRRGDYWQVRFDGGKETGIKHSVNIRTLVEYIANRGEILNRATIYYILHGGIPDQFNEGTIKHGKEENKQKVSQREQDISTNLISSESQAQIEAHLKKLTSNAEVAVMQGNEEAYLSLEGEINELEKTLKKEYNARINEDDSIYWGIAKETTDPIKAAKLTQLHLKRAVKMLRTKKTLNILTEHLDKYLLKNKDCYNPPHDFPEWKIIL